MGAKEYDQMTGIDKAIAAAGSEQALADMLGCTQQAVNKMKRNGYAPKGRVDQIANGFGIPREELIDPKLRELVKGAA